MFARIGVMRALTAATFESLIPHAKTPIGESESWRGQMTDQELLIATLRKASRIIGEYLEPGPRDADETIAQLIAVLDNQDLALAIERLEKGHGLQVVK